jgi:hypothetical protein
MQGVIDHDNTIATRIKGAGPALRRLKAKQGGE